MFDYKFYKNRLNQRLFELNEFAKTGDEAAKPVELDQTRVGRLSRMDAMQVQAMSIEAKRRREQEIVRIKSALQRINEETFGDCMECAKPISPARLNLDPSAILCINCAEKRT